MISKVAVIAAVDFAKFLNVHLLGHERFWLLLAQVHVATQHEQWQSCARCQQADWYLPNTVGVGRQPASAWTVCLKPAGMNVSFNHSILACQPSCHCCCCCSEARNRTWNRTSHQVHCLAKLALLYFSSTRPMGCSLPCLTTIPCKRCKANP